MGQWIYLHRSRSADPEQPTGDVQDIALVRFELLIAEPTKRHTKSGPEVFR
ncbi:MAG: hypothetical protein V3T64_02605 [Myxococcota bacterium]